MDMMSGAGQGRLVFEVQTEHTVKDPEQPVTFFVAGTPVGKGSMRAFISKKTYKPIITHMSERTKSWQQVVKWAALKVAPVPLWTGPVEVAIDFSFIRPRSHFKKRNAVEIRPDAPEFPGLKDIDKLLRTCLDALTGVFYVDDAQVANIASVSKRYGKNEGAQITVRKMAPEELTQNNEKGKST